MRQAKKCLDAIEEEKRRLSRPLKEKSAEALERRVRQEQRRCLKAKQELFDYVFENDALKRQVTYLRRRLIALNGERGRRTFDSIERLFKNRQKQAQREMVDGQDSV